MAEAKCIKLHIGLESPNEDIAFMKKNAKMFIEFSESEKKKLIETVQPAMREFSKKHVGDMYGKLWGLLEATK